MCATSGSTTRAVPSPTPSGTTQMPGSGPGCCTWDVNSGCQQLANEYCQVEENCEGNCFGKWILTAVTSTALPATTTTSPEPVTTTLAPSTSSEATCELDKNMKACVAGGGSFECQKCPNDYTGEPCCSCHGGEAPTTTTVTTTVTVATKPCKSWCGTHPKPWEKKCKWSQCAGCSGCSARRLRGSDTSVV